MEGSVQIIHTHFVFVFGRQKHEYLLDARCERVAGPFEKLQRSVQFSLRDLLVVVKMLSEMQCVDDEC
jgi:hypothetical protein